MASNAPRPLTLKQVAEHAGVHVSTVSRALDPERRHLIGSEALARVEAAARELGFRPNQAAAALRRGRSKAIAVLVPNMINPVMGQIMQGVESAIVDRGYFPLVVSMHAAPSSAGVIERLLSQRVDGVVVATAPSDDVIVQALVDAGIAAVMVNRRDAGNRISAVISDSLHAMTLAVDHLHALGHRRIALLAGPQTLASGTRRLNDAQQALAAHRLKPHGVATGDAYTRQAGEQACAQLLAQRGTGRRAQSEGFTAICAANGMVPLGAYDALKTAGLKVPDDMSVIGQNDMMLVDMVSPPLTTVHVHHYEMGHEAGRLLIEEIEAAGTAPARSSKVIAFRPELVVRSSTAAPR